jgi:sarcosine oxidase
MPRTGVGRKTRRRSAHGGESRIFLLDPEEATRRYPQHRFGEEHVIVLDQQAGYLRPELAVLSAARRAEELGAELHRDLRVEAIEETGRGVHIRAGGQTYAVSQVIVTAGPWTEQLLADLPVRCPTPSVSASTRTPLRRMGGHLPSG